MKKSLGRKAAALFMAAIMGVASSVCTPSMAVKAESATVTDAEEEIVDVQEEQVEQTDQTTEDEEIIDIEVMAGDVPIDSAHFPDENFRKYVSENFDTDSNGVLSSGEINYVKEINLYYNDISSLQGIEYFTELEDLTCYYNRLSSLDVSKNIKLKKLECSGNNLSILDVSKNTLLESLTIYDNNISSLDVSNNTMLKDLYCSFNNLSSIDVSNNVNLESLSCDNNNLSNLDVSKNVNLVILNCDNNNLSNIDVSKNKLLEILTCSENNLVNLDVIQNDKLRTIFCTDNKLTNLDLSGNQLLGGLECSNNNLESLNISKNTNLTYLDCVNNKIDNLDLSKNTKLTYICCQYNMIQNLDVSNCGELYTLSCDANAIRNTNFSNNSNLTELNPYIVLDSNGRYDLSQLSWIELEKVKNIEFKYAIDWSMKQKYKLVVNDDNYSFLSGNIINILNYNWGLISFSYEDKDVELIYDTLNESDINPGIFVMNADRNHYVAGLATTCAPVDKTRLEYSWVAQDASGNFIQMSDWSKSEWVDWTPEKYGTYTIFAKVRIDGGEEWSDMYGREPRIYTTVGQYDYHPYIKGKCQLPCSAVNPGQPGYLIGVESYENPNQSYQFEMLILDCTLLAQGLPAWTYSTGKFTVPEGNAGWCVWNPQYGYYWTLFRIYDGAGNLIDEYCYPFVNAY